MSERRGLPAKRVSENFKLTKGRHKIFVTVGYYPDGNPGEVFIDAAKEGTELRGIMNAFAMATSLALQHGCPLNEITESLRGFGEYELPSMVADVLKQVRPA
jgi:ribonucleoside-diphosphate reductase alpha chain